MRVTTDSGKSNFPGLESRGK